MKNELMSFAHAPAMRRPNALKIPVTQIERTIEGARLFNRIYAWCREQTEYKTLQRTASGGISIARGIFRPPCWDVRELNKYCTELTIIDIDGMWRIQFRNGVEEDKAGKKNYGRKAFKIFKDTAKEFGIDFDKYAQSEEEGKKAKAEIKSPPSRVARPMYVDRIFTNVHHIDYHSSYPAGLMNTHPEFEELIRYIYANRHNDNTKFKLVLNSSLGMMQSDITKFRWAALARDAIADNNVRINGLARALTEAGRIVLMFNTDGIWYAGDIYHGPGEGDTIGQWYHDYLDCDKFRMRSPKAYEFTFKGKYYVRLSGRCKLDYVKPRKDWVWGDLYHKDAVVHEFKFVFGEGIKKDGELL